MNKKTYITPAMETMNMETVEMMATSSLSFFSDKEVDTTSEGGQLGNERRGSWGNLWDEE